MTEYLSKHFTLDECIYSETAEKLGIKNEPTDLHKKCLKHTCEYLMEPLRTLLNEKYKTYAGKKVKYVIIKITSGYRSALLNSKIKGASKTSQHCKGFALDCEARIVLQDGAVKVLPYTELYENVKGWVKIGKISVDQCIQERAGNDVWVHLSHHPSGRSCDRRQFLKYNGKTYTLDTK